MTIDRFDIKDRFRQNLTRYTLKAFSFLPEINELLILDLGCGTGEPTIAVAGIIGNGTVYTIDSDENSLNKLNDKIRQQRFEKRIKSICSPVFDLDLRGIKFDIILAEGLFNVIGFEQGLTLSDKHIKKNGFLIIHDELADENKKDMLLEEHGYLKINSFVLSENIWWDDYYARMEKFISELEDTTGFETDIAELEMFRKDPSLFRSVYYIAKKTG